MALHASTGLVPASPPPCPVLEVRPLLACEVHDEHALPAPRAGGGVPGDVDVGSHSAVQRMPRGWRSYGPRRPFYAGCPLSIHPAPLPPPPLCPTTTHYTVCALVLLVLFLHAACRLTLPAPHTHCRLPPTALTRATPSVRHRYRRPPDTTMKFLVAFGLLVFATRNAQALSGPPYWSHQGAKTGRRACSITPCNECTGNCNSDSDCAGSLVCFKFSQGGTITKDNTDIPSCIKTNGFPIKFMSNFNWCVNKQAAINVAGWPTLGGDLKSSGTNPRKNNVWLPRLGPCRGDCDSDSDCMVGTVCKQRDGTKAIAGCRGPGVPDHDCECLS